MKRNLFALFGSVAVLLTATAASIAASAQAGTQTSGTQESLTAQTPSAPMIQQQDQTIQDPALERLQDLTEDFLSLLD